MRGSAVRRPIKLRSLGIRFAVAGALVLWLAQLYGDQITREFVPIVRAALNTVQDDFTVLSIDMAHENASTTMSVRADLAHPLYVANRVVYPLNSNPTTAGWMQVNITTGGVLQYLVMVAIVVLAWPAFSILEYGSRVAIGGALGFLLAVSSTVTTILAELWFPLHDDLAPTEVWPLLVWSRFLMGGGGLALALGLAAIAISIAANVATRGASSVRMQHYA